MGPDATGFGVPAGGVPKVSEWPPAAGATVWTYDAVAEWPDPSSMTVTRTRQFKSPPGFEGGGLAIPNGALSDPYVQ